MTDPNRSARFESIVADYYDAVDEGRTTPHLDQLLSQHPDLEAELRAFWNDVAVVQQRVAPLCALVVAMPPAGLPRSVDAFTLGAELGRGGMGVVVRAQDVVLRRPVALKIMLADPRKEPTLVQRFMAEAQVLGQLQHPYIVPLHQLGKLADGRPYLAMKLVQGETLAARLAVRPAEARELAAYHDRLLDVFGCVCQALAHAHSRGVLHRDLKPQNVMVGEHAEVQVMDWGFAKVRAGSAAGPAVQTLRDDADPWASQQGDVMGTFAYMAPEQAQGKIAELDERCDVFGLGAILCEMLTGRPPYTAATRADAAKLKELKTP
jgi:serine/threonine-protein kinase